MAVPAYTTAAVAVLALLSLLVVERASAVRVGSLFPLLPFNKVSQFSRWSVAQTVTNTQAVPPAPTPIPIDIAVPPGPPIVLPVNGPPPPGILNNVPPARPFDFPPPPPSPPGIITPDAPGPVPSIPAFPPPPSREIPPGFFTPPPPSSPPPTAFPPPNSSPPPPNSSPPPPNASPPPVTASPPPPSSPPPNPASPPPSGQCPTSPTSLCDFYFEGFANSIPTFKVMDGVGDTRISPPITASVKGVQIDVIAANSANGDYLCTNGQPNNPDPNNWVVGKNPDNQFYATQDAVQSRTFQPATGGIQPFLGNLVKLQLTSVELNIFNMVTNLNQGQPSDYFPEDRRCVLFSVGQ